MGQAAAGQAHAQGLGQTAHGIGCAQHGAGANAGQGGLLDLHQLVFGEPAGLGAANQLPHVGESDRLHVLVLSREHGPARDDDGRDVQPHGDHQHAGDDLVAAGEHHHAVELMGLDHVLGGVGDEFPAGQGIAHPFVPLADAVADGDGAELPGDAPRLDDPLLNEVRQLPQVEVAWYHLSERVDHCDHGFAQVLPVQTGAVQQRPVSRPLNPVGQHPASVILKVHLLLWHVQRSFPVRLFSSSSVPAD